MKQFLARRRALTEAKNLRKAQVEDSGAGSRIQAAFVTFVSFCLIRLEDLLTEDNQENEGVLGQGNPPLVHSQRDFERLR
jgi:hypothetical protein